VVFNLTSTFNRTISADFFVLPFEISAYSNGSHLGSKITFGQVFDHKIVCHFSPQNMQNRLKEKAHRRTRNVS